MTGKAVGEQLGIDEVIANVMPEDKSRIIEEQKEKIWSYCHGWRWCERCTGPC